jgi:hypothetical protein
MMSVLADSELSLFTICTSAPADLGLQRTGE